MFYRSLRKKRGALSKKQFNPFFLNSCGKSRRDFFKTSSRRLMSFSNLKLVKSFLLISWDMFFKDWSAWKWFRRKMELLWCFCCFKKRRKTLFFWTIKESSRTSERLLSIILEKHTMSFRFHHFSISMMNTTLLNLLLTLRRIGSFSWTALSWVKIGVVTCKG